MFRLALVFAVWMASTSHAVDERAADLDLELHQAYGLAWNEADEVQRTLLERAQRGWYVYRAATCALAGPECHALMAQERAAELRRLAQTEVRTIVPAHDRSAALSHGILAGPAGARARGARDERP
jgi:hypothetical protein